ncbi:fatty acid cis/trans isomerase [Methylophaga frappieri]|uniref:fatty acid cis/trans isomerase n=1 Tax=Methylophaga frappieri (strain ATCC BAA-2434 / DSM 25690 / JAM7) TaxID=754477 RepID=UPI000308F659|nr:fatty acid cis/trans isomerase [Methylophaga frappieri]
MGLLRGASQDEVYDGVRTEPQRATRLGIDADTVSEWRSLDFYSVIETNENVPSLMANMLKLAKQYPHVAHEKVSDSIRLGTKRQNQCPLPEKF